MGLLQYMLKKTTSLKMDNSFRCKDKLINVTTEKRCLLCEPKGPYSQGMGEMEELLANPGVADMVLQLPFEQLKFSHYTASCLEVQAISFRFVHKTPAVRII